MTNPQLKTALPRAWLAAVRAQLETGERLVNFFEPDLDGRLNYAEGFVMLTNRRLLALMTADQAVWRSWPLAEVKMLALIEQGGIGVLRLNDGPLQWPFTAARLGAARAFVQGFTDFKMQGLDTWPAASLQDHLWPRDPTQGVIRRWRDSPLLRLRRFARPQRGAIVLGLVLTLAATTVALIPPYLTMPLIDRVLIPYQNGVPVDPQRVIGYLAGLTGAAVLAWALGWARRYVLARVSERIAMNLRNTAYAHLQTLSLEFFSARRTGDLIARLSSDTDRICNFLAANLVDFITDVLMILLTAVILLTIDVRLALATLLPFPFILWLVNRVRTRLRHGFVQSFRAWGEMTSVLADTIPGVRVVKAFAQERREVARFQQANTHILNANDHVNHIWAAFGPLVVLLTEVGVLVVWAVGVGFILRGEITIGVLTAFLAYISRFYGRLESMTRMVQVTQRAQASAQRVFEVLDQQPGVPEPVKPAALDGLRGAIELCEVTFRYDTRPALQGITLTIRPGELIGLVGSSGAGKSTLINLICRFYDPDSGAIRVDGVDIRRYPVERYRQHIGLVLQEPFLFYGTVAENIAYGRPDAARAEIIAAARAAHAHDFIMALPDGYDSLVGERGQTLSGGERQRISIARALLIDPRILILDEATSSVDIETEREIQAALNNLIRGRTTIAIAHRLSTLRAASRLVVLEAGCVVEMGSHAELLARSGTYARLHRAQLEMAGHTGS